MLCFAAPPAKKEKEAPKKEKAQQPKKEKEAPAKVPAAAPLLLTSSHTLQICRHFLLQANAGFQDVRIELLRISCKKQMYLMRQTVLPRLTWQNIEVVDSVVKWHVQLSTASI